MPVSDSRLPRRDFRSAGRRRHSRWDEANRYAAITADVLGAYCDGIDRATALLSGRQ